MFGAEENLSGQVEAGGRRAPGLCFSWRGSRDLLLSRMRARQGHFMPASLLDSQLQTLEPPTGEAGVVTVTIDMALDDMVALACEELRGAAVKGGFHAG